MAVAVLVDLIVSRLFAPVDLSDVVAVVAVVFAVVGSLIVIIFKPSISV